MIIVDGNNMAYRALFTMSLSNSRGEDVSIIYGVLRMLSAMLHRYRPSSLVVCFDGGVPEFRRRLWPDYKSNRMKDTDIDWDNVYDQMEQLRRHALPIHGVKVLWHPGIEADDLMACVSRMSREGTMIVTTDDDLLQCLSDNVDVLNPTKNVTYTIDNLWRKRNVHPRHWLIYKALVGDSSDNISGVPNVGPKTAINLLAEALRDNLDMTDYNVLCQHAGLAMNARQRGSLEALGEDAWNRMLAVMDLSVDRAGAGWAIAQSMPWMRAQSSAIQRWLFDHEFVSMLDADYIREWMWLEGPNMSFDGVRTPAPWIERCPN